MEDGHNKSHLIRKASKQAKPISRTSKRSSYLQEQGAVVISGGRKRVWKACERCRMKKTKCDGESPCKRCKDDGSVCTVGSRKKTEFKQLPIGYAEVLEDTQYALIATVQKLYTMIQNNESWDLGEPEMNIRGEPVIHDIASKLGCIRPSQDIPVAFPEGEEDFAELQAQLQASRSEMGTEESGSRTLSGSSPSSPSLAHTERASSTESDHSALSKDYNQTLWAQQQTAAKVNRSTINTSVKKATPPTLQINSKDDNSPYSISAYSASASFDTNASITSSIYTDFQTQSPMFRKASLFPSWPAVDDFFGPPHALDLTSQFMSAQQCPSISGPAPLDGSLDRPIDLVEPNVLKAIQLQDWLNFTDGIITPHMLDCSTVCDPSSQVDCIIFGNEYESYMGRA